MIIIERSGTSLLFREETLGLEIRRGESCWRWREESRPRLVCAGEEILFAEAGSVSHQIIENGLGAGIRSRYLGFTVRGRLCEDIFETYIWIEETSGEVYFEWIPVKEGELEIERIIWPGEVEFDQADRGWYTLLTHQQGILLPNTWETELSAPPFDGFFETAGGYMPWFGQVKDRNGYLAVCETPWDAGYYAEHPAGGPYTHVGMWFTPSLGKMGYRRMIRYTFLENCDYNDLCKVYRRQVDEKGNLRTLEEKAARNPSVRDLIGCMFVHQGIKTYVRPDSAFYDPEKPEKNNHVITFKCREKEIRDIYNKGVKKLYLHLDGWGEPGYDNQHPDYLPPCQEAGGYEGMKSLADTLRDCGYLFGIHDQYRDYYLASPGYEEELAVRLPDGTIPGHNHWAGGPQSYLCATQAPYFVRRNFSVLKEHGIIPDCAYLDVFTCNEGDECANPRHRMTRRECYEYRGRCLEYLLSQGILTSSEEVSDWAVPHLVFCHYAPYDFMMRRPGSPKEGIPVPLFNLVYHDCVIQPWMMEENGGKEDYMLYALLNGGAPYLIRDAAYPNVDGAFSSEQEVELEEQIRRCRAAASLHERVAACEMIRHDMKEDDPYIQSTLFSDGTRVKINLHTQEYEIVNENR